MIIDQFNADPKNDKKGEFKYSMLPEKDRNLKSEEEKYPSIHIFTDGPYYDHAYSGMMVYRIMHHHYTFYSLNYLSYV